MDNNTPTYTPAARNSEASLPRYLRRTAWVLAGFVLWIAWITMLKEDPWNAIQEYWPVTVVAILAATIANATAVGGGLIFFPFFFYVHGLGGLVALKLALATQAFGMTTGAITWSKALIVWRPLRDACLSGGLGMIVGTVFWSSSSHDIKLYFGIVSVLIGFALIAELCAPNRSGARPRHTTYQCNWGFLALCTIGGLITAWISIGIGEIVALWMIFRWQFSVGQSVATGVATLAFCSIVGFAIHTVLGGIPWEYLVFTVPGVIIGGATGALLGKVLSHETGASRKPDGFKLKLIMAAVISLHGISVLSH